MLVVCFRETNLKVKQAFPDTAVLGDDLEKFKAFDGKLYLIQRWPIAIS
jgi:hypothetical protein